MNTKLWYVCIIPHGIGLEYGKIYNVLKKNEKTNMYSIEGFNQTIHVEDFCKCLFFVATGNSVTPLIEIAAKAICDNKPKIDYDNIKCFNE